MVYMIGLNNEFILFCNWPKFTNFMIVYDCVHELTMMMFYNE